jgi:hypothetical protein
MRPVDCARKERGHQERLFCTAAGAVLAETAVYDRNGAWTDRAL